MFKNLEKYQRIYLVGIGGISMSALSVWLKSEGHHVAGCDANISTRSDYFISNGIRATSECSVQDIARSNLVVYSGAISESDPSRVMARKLGVKCMERGELLGTISQNYEKVIAISGSHGKTTITSMLGYIFCTAGLNPTIHVGGVVPFMNSNMRVGSKKYLITEACEYRDSFLSLKPTVSVVTSVDAEHLDYFGSLEKEEKSFAQFCKNTLGKCFVSSSAKHFLNIAPQEVEIYPNETKYVKNVFMQDDGKYTFDYVEDGKEYKGIKLNLLGRHNVDNALCAIMVARLFGIDMEKIIQALSSFNGVQSRFEINTYKDGRKLIYDYAHHPNEIKTTLQTINDVKNKNYVCFFQPHTYSRTKVFFDDFINVLKEFESLVLLPTYSAREKIDEAGSSYALYKSLSKIKSSVYYMNLSDVPQFVSSLPKDKSVIFLGAGDVQNLMRD